MPTTTANWKKAKIDPGGMDGDGFIRPDGDYRISIDQVADNIGTTRDDVFDFLESKALKSMIGEGGEYQLINSDELAVDAVTVAGKIAPIQTVALEVAVLYWQFHASQGNKKALAICVAQALENLEERFDEAFGAPRVKPGRRHNIVDLWMRIICALGG